MATSEAAKSSKKCCISFLISKLGAKLLYLHQLRAKQSYLQNFTDLCCSLLYLDLWDKYLDILYHKLQFTGPPMTVSLSWKQKFKFNSFNTRPPRPGGSWQPAYVLTPRAGGGHFKLPFWHL